MEIALDMVWLEKLGSFRSTGGGGGGGTNSYRNHPGNPIGWAQGGIGGTGTSYSGGTGGGAANDWISTSKPGYTGGNGTSDGGSGGTASGNYASNGIRKSIRRNRWIINFIF